MVSKYVQNPEDAPKAFVSYLRKLSYDELLAIMQSSTDNKSIQSSEIHHSEEQEKQSENAGDEDEDLKLDLSETSDNEIEQEEIIMLTNLSNRTVQRVQNESKEFQSTFV